MVRAGNLSGVSTTLGLEGLSAEQRALVTLVYRARVTHGAWPRWAHVSAVARQDAGFDPSKACASLPRGFVRPEPGWRGTPVPLDDDEIALTVAALSIIPEANDDINLFVQVLSWIGSKAESHRPPPTGESALRLTGDEIAAAVGRAPADPVMTRVYEYLQYDTVGVWTTIGHPRKAVRL